VLFLLPLMLLLMVLIRLAYDARVPAAGYVG
jgi:hypothetical protein